MLEIKGVFIVNVVFVSDTCLVSDLNTCLDSKNASIIQEHMDYMVQKSAANNSYFVNIPPLKGYHSVDSSHVAKWLGVNYGVK